MIYLTAPASTVSVRAVLRGRGDVGVLLTPRHRRGPEYVGRYACFAADSGCFRHPEAFDLGTYLDWLGRLAPLAAERRCLFATAPDRVGDWAATWRLSAPALPRIRAAGFPAAVVAQDGMAALPPAGEYDALFVGGTTAWKLSEGAYRLAAGAKAAGKWLHMGRVNSLSRLRAAHVSLFDSADGTHLAFRPDARIAEVRRWLDRLNAQPALPGLWETE